MTVSPDDDAADPEDLDQQDIATLEEPDPNPSGVSYKGTDFDVEGLVRRLNRGDAIVLRLGISEICPLRRHVFSAVLCGLGRRWIGSLSHFCWNIRFLEFF